jgi:GWxTD domain-containing protein
MSEKVRLLTAACLFSLLSLASGCRLYNLERRLSPAYADFLSKVRYISTRQEEKIFLELPDSEKDAFIEEFWKRRDPDPDTEENEFKMEYFDRLENAERLFPGEGKPGWRTDRGRIYILFGPPMDRITNTIGDDYGRCSEVWYYGNFPLVFRDQNCSGQYQLVTYDLSALRDINLMYMHELSLAQARAQKTFKQEKAFFDFGWRVMKEAVEPDKIRGTIVLSIPYAGIWFKEAGGLLRTQMEARLELRESDGQLFWEVKTSFEIAIAEDELKKKMKASFKQEIPFLWEGNLERLRKGRNKLLIRLKNLTGGDEQQKVMEMIF